MAIIKANKSITDELEFGNKLTVIVSSNGSGTFKRYFGSTLLETITLTAGSTRYFGEYISNCNFSIDCYSGSIEVLESQGTGLVSNINSLGTSLIDPISGKGFYSYNQNNNSANTAISVVSTTSLPNDATHGRALYAELTAVADFYAVRPYFVNYSTTDALVIDSAIIGSPSRAPKISGYHGEVSNENLFVVSTLSTVMSDVRYNGLPVSSTNKITVPVAKTSAGSQTVPSIVQADVIALKSTARADFAGETQPLIITGVHIEAGATASILPAWSGNYKLMSTDPRNNGFRYSNVEGTAGASYNATAYKTNVYTTNGSASRQSCMAVDIFYGEKVLNLAFFGDSLMQGVGSTGDYIGTYHLVQWLAYADGKKISTAGYSTSGQKSETTLELMQKVIPLAKPQFALMHGWSPNDGFTQADFDRAYGCLLGKIDICKRNGVTPVVLTSAPASGATWSIIQAQNARIQSLDVMVIDESSAMNNPSNNGNIIAAYTTDGTHRTDAGYDVVAALIYNTFKSYI